MERGTGMLPALSDVRWRKSSASGGEGTECVELAWAGACVTVRHPTARNCGCLWVTSCRR